jgi:type IV pilus assembly protein PilW
MEPRSPLHTLCPPRRHAAGMTLIELMVGLVIALVISLVIFNVFIVTEGQRRTTAAGSDAQQAGALSSYSLARYLRMGGAGLERVAGLWGCNILISTKNGNGRVPLPDTLGAPFSDLGLSGLRAAPVLIVNGSNTDNNDATSGTPDALMMFGGVHRSINTFLQGSREPSIDDAPVLSSVGLRTNDLLLAVEQNPASPNFGGSCQLVQAISEIDDDPVSATYLQSKDNAGRTVKITGGQYTPSTGLVPGGVAYSGVTLYANLGAAPLFRMFALGPSAASPSELRMYDVISGPTDQNPQSLGDGVVNMQAVYGVGAAGSTVITNWVQPVGTYSAANLMNGSAASAALIETIRAVRIVMVTRSALPERDAVSPEEFTLFDDDPGLSLTVTRDADARKYRYRVFDEIVPVRNMLL